MRQPRLPRGRDFDVPAPPRVICQTCGDAKAEDAAIADGWLVATWRIDRSIKVVRCYRHISEWSLRCSSAGRTKESRELMANGRRRAAEEKSHG